MDISNLRAAYRAQPFRPFVIHAGSVESYPVRHPETIAYAPDVSVPVMLPGPGKVAMIDLDSITEITYDFTVKSSNADS